MGTYTQPGKVIDKSLSTVSAIGAKMIAEGAENQKKRNAEKKLIKQNKLKRTNEINKQISGDKAKIYSIQGPTEEATIKIQKLYSDELDRISKIGKNAIGGDEEEYWNALAQLESSIATVPNFLGVINHDSKKYAKSKTIAEDQPGAYLNNTGAGEIAFFEDIDSNNGSGLNFSYENGQLIVNKDYEGLDENGNKTQESFMLNSKEYLNAYEEGKANIINYVKDKSNILKPIWESYSSDYKPIEKSILQDIKDGKKGTSIKTTFQEYKEANDRMMAKLSDSDQVKGAIDQSMWQQLKMDEDGDGNIDPFNPKDPEQINAAAKKLAEKMMGQYGSTDKITAIYEDQLQTEKTDKPDKPPKPDISDNYSTWASNIMGDDSTEPREQAQRFITTISAKIDPSKDGKYATGTQIINSPAEDDDGNKIEIPKKVKDSPNGVFLIRNDGTVGTKIIDFGRKDGKSFADTQKIIDHFSALKKSTQPTQGPWSNFLVK